ncbi:hypothetical protein PPL_05029 [Heterostelium album PN500]|uniref:Uncharacterized protein n=1 Tax=Heterostelium pallidum (strain ATCC 26659 / Pp 5 / PN500) TaxID=670386 RepID=D3B985_HETP5|nr:hypothetical protein PPL_05029 [Heterostelium album PN500]EFA82124.1 hypothetical protein PPL_05029 [Heterostelium album PN500]|eukprot:XP_020434241.1 hypothetical protein PPL_05029 [Heterostelium album PN500]
MSSALSSKTTTVIQSGYLFKKDGKSKLPGRSQAWKKRFFVLDNQSLSYLKSEKPEAKLYGKIAMSDLQAIQQHQPTATSSHLWTLDIHTKDRTYYLSSNSESDINQWTLNLTSFITITTSTSVQSSKITSNNNNNKNGSFFVNNNNNNSSSDQVSSSKSINNKRQTTVLSTPIPTLLNQSNPVVSSTSTTSTSITTKAMSKSMPVTTSTTTTTTNYLNNNNNNNNNNDFGFVMINDNGEQPPPQQQQGPINSLKQTITQIVVNAVAPAKTQQQQPNNMSPDNSNSQMTTSVNSNPRTVDQSGNNNKMSLCGASIIDYAKNFSSGYITAMVAVSPKKIWTGDSNGNIVTWSAASDKLKKGSQWKKHQHAITSLVYIPSQNAIYSASTDTTICAWHEDDFTLIFTHNSRVPIYSMIEINDSLLLYCGYSENFTSIALLDINTQTAKDIPLNSYIQMIETEKNASQQVNQQQQQQGKKKVRDIRKFYKIIKYDDRILIATTYSEIVVWSPWDGDICQILEVGYQSISGMSVIGNTLWICSLPDNTVTGFFAPQMPNVVSLWSLNTLKKKRSFDCTHPITSFNIFNGYVWAVNRHHISVYEPNSGQGVFEVIDLGEDMNCISMYNNECAWVGGNHLFRFKLTDTWFERSLLPHDLNPDVNNWEYIESLLKKLSNRFKYNYDGRILDLLLNIGESEQLLVSFHIIIVQTLRYHNRNQSCITEQILMGESFRLDRMANLLQSHLKNRNDPLLHLYTMKTIYYLCNFNKFCTKISIEVLLKFSIQSLPPAVLKYTLLVILQAILYGFQAHFAVELTPKDLKIRIQIEYKGLSGEATISDPSIHGIYSIDWSVLGRDCDSITNQSQATLICDVDTATGYQSVSQIKINQYLPKTQEYPSNITELKFANLTTFYLTKAAGVVEKQNINILSMLDVQSNTKLVKIEFAYNVNVSSMINRNMFKSPMQEVSVIATNPPVIVDLPENEIYNTLTTFEGFFPRLKFLQLNRLRPDISLIIDSDILQSLIILDKKSSGVIRISRGSSLTTLQIGNQSVSPENLGLFPINNFVSYNNSQNFKFKNLINLSKYDVARNIPFPDESMFSPNTSSGVSLYLGNGETVSTLPLYNSIRFAQFSVTGYPGLTGSIPSSLCTLQRYNLVLTNTNLSKASDCLYCYWDLVYLTLPSTITPPTLSFDCGKYQYSSAITINGDNLGYVVPPGILLEIKIPNTQMIFYPGVRTSGTQEFSFNTYSGVKNLTIMWSGDTNSVNLVKGVQVPYGLNLTLFGSFNIYDDVKIIMDGITNTDILVLLDTMYVTFNHVFDDEKILKIQIQSNSKTNPIDYKYKKVYPYISWISNVTSDGGLITLNGNFGDYSQSGLNILINQTSICVPVSRSNSSIVCNADKLSYGVVPLLLTVDGYTFSTKLKIDPAQIIIDCGNTKPLCNGNGDCLAAGYCQCYSGFNGYYCENKIFDGGVIGENTTKPSPTFKANGEEFSFNMISIEELDSSRNVIKSIPTNNWNFNTTKNSTKTVTRYQLNHTSSEFIEATIQYSSEPMNVEFAGLSYVLPPNSIKLSISIDGWTYESLLNTLRVVFSTQFDEQNDCSFEKNSIGNNQIDNSINYLKIVKNGISFYGKFYDVSLSDGQPTYSFVEVVNNTNPNDISIGINLSQCQRCFIDPDFSLLVAVKDKCEEKSKTWIIITVVCVVGSVLLGLIVIGAFYLRKNRANLKLKFEIVLEKFEKK